MTKYKLDLDYDYSFALIGICSHLQDYRLCWALNKSLGLDLYRLDKSIEMLRGEHCNQFFVYRFEDEEDHVSYSLIGNKTHGSVLVPEHKQADYFLKIEGGMPDEIGLIINKIKAVKNVLTAFEIREVELLKSKENLIFD